MRKIQLAKLIQRRRQRMKLPAHTFRRRLSRTGLGCGALLLVTLLVGMISINFAYSILVRNLPSLDRLPALLDPQQGLYSQPTRFYDRSGDQVLLTLENPGIPRRSLPLDPREPESMSPQLVRVAVGIFDPGFWSRPGFSLRNLFSPDPHTIAERLADDLLLWQETPGLRRTLRMRILGTQLVHQYGHVQVMEWFLNSAPYGHLAYGADSAARLYLGKPASQVNLAEAALLIAAIESPALNALEAPSAAVERQRSVLERLLQTGVIEEEEYEEASSVGLGIAGSPADVPSPAAAFARLALDRLAEQFDRERIERGGLQVITTLDYTLQLELNCLARTQLARLAGVPEEVDGSCASALLLPPLPPGSHSLPRDLTTSAVVLDPQTGQVLALLGDTSLDGESPWQAARAPGTVISPFLALNAFQRGLGPASLVWDIPSNLPDELVGLVTPPRTFHGPVRMRVALANDYLVSLSQLLAQTGTGSLAHTAGALGIAGLTGDEGLRLLYNAGQVAPLEVAQAYGVLAAQGVRAGQRSARGGDPRPDFLLAVEDLEGIAWLDARSPETQTVVTDALAYLVHHVISDTTARQPSLGSANWLDIGRPAGVKTGRVDGGQAAWTAGYIPQRSVVFWLGVPSGTEPGQVFVQPRMAAGMYTALMQYMGSGLPVQDWTEPAGVAHAVVCDPSGHLPTSACPLIVNELFLAGSEPVTVDTLYETYEINRETGRLATIFTPSELIEEKTFLVVPPMAAGWARTAGLAVPPEEYDAIQPVQPAANVRLDWPDGFTYVTGQVDIEGTAAGEGFQYYQVQVGQGLNPRTWIQIGPDGSQPVTEGLLGQWDARDQEGLFALRLLVVRADQQVETHTIQVTVDNTPPEVEILAPMDHQLVDLSAGQGLLLRCQAVDDLGIQQVAWLVDGRVVDKSLAAPYTLLWEAHPGSHTLQARAYDLAGNWTDSDLVQITVDR